jgi:hypothetical protein
MAFHYASETMRANGNILLFALRQPLSDYFISPLKSATPELQGNLMIVRIAIEQDSRAIEFASKSLQKALGQEAQTQ